MWNPASAPGAARDEPVSVTGASGDDSETGVRRLRTDR
jgi:hypothetical protein